MRENSFKVFDGCNHERRCVQLSRLERLHIEGSDVLRHTDDDALLHKDHDLRCELTGWSYGFQKIVENHSMCAIPRLHFYKAAAGAFVHRARRHIVENERVAFQVLRADVHEEREPVLHQKILGVGEKDHETGGQPPGHGFASNNVPCFVLKDFRTLLNPRAEVVGNHAHVLQADELQELSHRRENLLGNAADDVDGVIRRPRALNLALEGGAVETAQGLPELRAAASNIVRGRRLAPVLFTPFLSDVTFFHQQRRPPPIPGRPL